MAEKCEICGKNLTIWNHAWGINKCSPCAKGRSPEAKRMYVQRQPEIAQELANLPDIPIKKAVRIERNFAVWSVLLALWLFFGFFNMVNNFSDCNNYIAAVKNIRLVSSFNIKPEFTDMVERLSVHIDALETLQIYFILVTLISVPAWVCLFPIRKEFLQRNQKGPLHLLVLLIVFLIIHALGALLSLRIPMTEVMGFVDVFQIRVLPFVLLIIILTLTPFLGKTAQIFYLYTAIDSICFKKNGTGIELLKQQEETNKSVEQT